MTMPTGWHGVRLKDLFASVRNGIWGGEPGNDIGVSCARGTDFDRTVNRISAAKMPRRSVPVGVLREHLLRRGDLVLEKSGGGADQPVGSVALFDLPIRAVCSNFNARLQVASFADPRFACYLMNGLYWSGFTRQFVKQTTGIQNLDAEALLAQRCTVPSLDEQRRIADFLDAETGRIDQLLHGQLRMLDLLEERVDCRILEIIARSELVKPDSTPVLPIRRLLAKLDRPTMATDEIITAFRDGQVTCRSVRRSEGYTLTAS